jgi:hypothetical protein
MYLRLSIVDLLSEEQQEVLRNKGNKIERLQSGKPKWYFGGRYH